LRRKIFSETCSQAARSFRPPELHVSANLRVRSS
jgi:hypothetical protein